MKEFQPPSLPLLFNMKPNRVGHCNLNIALHRKSKQSANFDKNENFQ